VNPHRATGVFFEQQLALIFPNIANKGATLKQSISDLNIPDNDSQQK
jgi:hypothetical protein